MEQVLIPEGLPIVELKLRRDVCEIPENLTRNIDRTLGTKYLPFTPVLDTQSGAVSIAGSAPSLKRTWKYLVGDVMACNAAHDFLIDKGIIPRWGMFFDAAEIIADFITPHKDVVYLIGSRCHKAVFDKLEGYTVCVWHVKGDADLEELLIKHKRLEPMIHGGSSAVTRAMFLTQTMGYKEIHLFGTDSSCDDGNTHIKPSLVREDLLPIFANGKWFTSTAQWAGQVEDFREEVPKLQKWFNVQIHMHGYGLMPQIARAMGCVKMHDSLHEET